MPLEIINRALREGITVKSTHFYDCCELEGCYVFYDGYPYIYYSELLEKNISRLRCVLAEELGHHFTSWGNGITKKHMCFRNRLYILQDENLAQRWAAENLMKTDKLAEAIRKNISTPWEIAEHFNVTEKMAYFRLELFHLKKAL